MSQFIRTWLIIFSCIAMLGCATQTNYVAPNRAKLGELRRIAVHISEFPSFSYFDRTQNITIGQAMLGIFGQAYRQAKDEEVKAAIRPQKAFSARVLLSESFQTALRTKGVYESVNFVGNPSSKNQQSGYDAVVAVNVLDWGVRMLPPRNPTYCWLWIDTTLVVQQQPEGTILLNDKVTVSKDSHETKEYFMENPSEIEDLFREMIDTAGRRMGALFDR